MDKTIGVYIHIPFCVSKCHYCDFVSFTDRAECIEKYIESICKEILINSELLSLYSISTIYIGGGTPSCIDSKYIDKILSTLYMFIPQENLPSIETTIEINPGTITEDTIKEYHRMGINRISIGLQSTHNDILKKLGRIHTYEDSIKAVELCKKYGIFNISLDMIYPLPDLTYFRFNESINSIVELVKGYDIPHISIYNLEIHEGTKLDFLLKEGYLTLPDEDEEFKMKELLKKTLNDNSFIQYEISNYSKKGFESKHNLNYWNQGMYLGFGVNASSFINGTRYSNLKNIDEYINNMKQDLPVVNEKIELDKLDLMKEYVILKLRLICGINIAEFKNKFGISINDIFKKELDKLINLKLLTICDSNIFLTDRGKDVANIVWQEFI